MKVNANGIELRPLAVDRILELLRHVDSIEDVLDSIIHVSVHELIHELFDLQINMMSDHHGVG
jgi:hypothetical protein